jgi:hypothetical protein
MEGRLAQALKIAGTEKLSLDELHTLRKIGIGIDSSLLPTAHRTRFRRLGWIEGKFGGDVLTASGRYQLEIRNRERDLILLARRWRNRAEELNVIAENMTNGEADTLKTIADQWATLARQVEELDALEKCTPLLG